MGSEVRSFRDLIAWQLGKALTHATYKWSSPLPVEERFGLTTQMRRAAVSIPSNIAEGFGQGTTAAYLRHLRIARGSLFELDTPYDIGSDVFSLPMEDSARQQIDECGRVLQGLISSLERRLENGSSK